MVAGKMFKTLREDIDAAMARDPAARSWIEIMLCYPGLHALILHRAAHALWRRDFRLLARWLSQVARFFTGIEIHPGARIGRRFFIDHGMGVVIGETAEIGNDVTLYHGVTLGGIAPSVESRAQSQQKRHPTLKDGAIIGSGAQILGPVTIGEKARVGANAVVVKDVPAGATAVGIPARLCATRVAKDSDDFVAYGTPTSDLSDPLVRAMDGLIERVGALQARVEALEKEKQAVGQKPGQTAEENEAEPARVTKM
ncbi:MAG TPA: serine O-acetyltransferase EpsC [Alphaproteobacteria bacterium]|jgi:serine O-acetyltransferase|nr:serine O-acetyltransferase EpsC [Alphaproteobacteria bacterium]